MNMIRKFIDFNIFLSKQFDKILPEKFTVDGNRYFIEKFSQSYLAPNLKVYDLGGGKQPLISLKIKHRLKLYIIGIDIDQNELNLAPIGSYDRHICADITKYRGTEDGDLVICQALLEHVKSINDAFACISSIVKKNGYALIFVPSKNAIYARLNIILPQSLKQQILYKIFPKTKNSQGFQSFYDQCTPNDLKKIAKKYNFSVENESYHYISTYFSFFFPLYFFWRIWIISYYALFGTQAAETFCFSLKKL